MGVMAFSISLRVIWLAGRGAGGKRGKGEEEEREERENQPGRREGIKKEKEEIRRET